MSAHKNRKKEYFDGVRAALPVILGFVPVGIAYAVMAHDAGFSALETVLMSLLVFAGASQMMAVGMYAQGAGLVAMITAAFIINLRHVIMSTCVFNRMGNTPLALRIISSAGVTDETFAIFTTSDEKRCTPAFFLGLVSVAYLSWAMGSLIGALASEALPTLVSASLGIAMYAMFIGLLVPSLRGNGRLALLVVITACVNTALSQVMTSSWALIVSTLVCAFAGVFFVDLGEDAA